MSSSEAMNRYWIPNMDIHKKVIVAEIQYHLGPQASVRPFTKEVRSFPQAFMLAQPAERKLTGSRPERNQGEDGFLIMTPGPCLSDEQIDDICIKSREMWERQAAARGSTRDKPLKRPLHKPVVISKSGSHGSHHRSRRGDDRGSSYRRRANT
ncbi:hypothetical protein RB595_001424 [Gaeumannomyces hyphopodioides]